ncbi:hypothetical protein R5R35_011714 [Gryllus longicercus]|uniref:HPS5-like beta-propeller domain-containing protein n=1 Tax=Gryllus longicercus TaxID=2509291 RepID=A0AAN9V7Z0_9ORTH
MADPSSEDEGLLREWAPLTNLLQQIPLKAQRGIFTHELNLTCVDALSDFIALGTNLGLVYWYSRRKGDLQRLRCENTASAITCVKVISTVDYMLAVGNEQGMVTVFQIPKEPPDSLPESMRPVRKKQVERYTINGLHTSSVTAIEWSLNGMKLFSGDKNGLVVLTEIDFYMHLSKSVELLNEKYEIVQLSYCQQLLLVSTTYRSIVCHRDDRWRVAQVGQKERKSLGKLGATFCLGSGRPQDLTVYASRPGLRLWLADKNGIVQQTLIYKDTMMQEHRHVPLINPIPAHMKNARGDHTFGPLRVFKDNLLVTYSQDTVYVLNPTDIYVVATVADLRHVQDVSVTKDEIFILEGDRSIIRVAYLPEAVLEPGHDFAARLKEHALPALPLQRVPFFGKESEDGDARAPDGWSAVVTADEAIELPPIVALPEGLANLTLDDLESGSINGVGSSGDEPKVNKEVFNRHRQFSSQSSQEFALLTEASRAEVLEKIGEQKFEEVVFKPKKKKKNKKMLKNKHFVSGAESGSDTISVNSARSNVSDSEDPWSSERLDMSSDWSGMSTRASSSANECALKRSSSEETLVRLGDSIISELGTLPGDDAGSCSEQSTRPSDLTVGNHPEEKVNTVPPGIQPDLRSPASIERDVADKEKLLAEVLKLDTLCLEKGPISDKESNTSGVDAMKPDKNMVSSETYVLSPVSAVGVSMSEKIECDLLRRNSVELSDDNTESQDEKLASIGSTLSYGPPSGSSAPPSNHASLEIAHPMDIDTLEEGCVVSERADNWIQYRTPDSIVGFCVCAHYVCCVDSNSRIHYSGVNGLSLKWQKADDRGEQISVSEDSKIVWKLHKGTAYALVLPSCKGPFGEKWIVAARDVQSVAIDDTVAWYVTLDSRVYIQKGLTPEKPVGAPVAVCCVFPTVRVSCFESAVWVLTSTDKVLYREGISVDVPEGTTWKEVSVPFPVMDMVLGCQGTGWVVDEKNVIHFTKDFAAKSPQWWQILISDYIFQPTTPLQHFCTKLTDNYLKNLRQSSTVIMAAGRNAMWISEKMADKIHMNKTEFTGHQWNRVNLKNLNPNYRWQRITARGMARDKGQLWLLSEAGDFFCYYPTSGNIHAIPIPDSVICLSATPQSIWLLSGEGQIYVRQLYTTLMSDTCWKRINLTQLGNIRFTHISCGSDTLWACSDQGDVYMTIGSPRSMASPTFAPAWIPADEKPECKLSFTKVYVGPQSFMVWALDKKRSVFVRQQILPDFPLGKGWSLVSGIEAVDLTVSESAVWALSAGGSVYRRYGISQTNCMGDYWKKIPGSVDFLTATLNDGLWALDKKSYLLRHTQLPVTLCVDDLDSKSSDACSSLEGDWEHVSVNKM